MSQQTSTYGLPVVYLEDIPISTEDGMLKITCQTTDHSIELKNKDFEEVLAGFCKQWTQTREKAEKYLRSKKYYGPYVCIGNYLVQATTDVARILKSRQDPKLHVLHLREDMYGNQGVCKIQDSK